jgi:arabinogalactan oligomer/maltooligosaccharide transport system substrate-binding protein
MQNSDFVEAMKNEELIACVSGLWHSKQMEEAMGENFGATMLPKYTVAGDSVQMASFCGYKIEGVSANSQNPEWAMKLARFLSDEENQIKRFEYKGECPSNVDAATSSEVQASPAVAALNAQAKYSHLQEVSDTFWSPTYIFGTQISSGNLDGLDMQTMLDDMVEGITS